MKKDSTAIGMMEMCMCVVFCDSVSHMFSTSEVDLCAT